MPIDDDELNPDVERILNEQAPGDDNAAFVPSYKLITDAKIPVSKHMGNLWKQRIESTKKKREPFEDRWREAIKYFLNDQMGHRTGDRNNSSGNLHVNSKINDQYSETENVVYSNVTTLLPAIYAKNPRIEITASTSHEQDDMFASMCERLVNNIFQLRYNPGINLKPKVRRAILNTLLTNEGYIKIGYEPKSGDASEDITQIAEALENAKNPQEIEELEGKLRAIEMHNEVITNSGLYARCVSPFNIWYDTSSIEPDRSDANWLIEKDSLPTEYIKARFLHENEDGEWVGAYDATHVLMSSEAGDSEEDLIKNFSLFEKDTSYKEYGFEDEETFKRSQMTEVYWIWDKITRRVYLFHKDFWKWPLWVWDDPYRLTEFFPYYRLNFYDSPNHSNAIGEVTYYLDQQDRINEINSSVRRAIQWARNNIVFDTRSGLTEADVQRLLTGPDTTAKGIAKGPDQDWEDLFHSIIPPDISKYSQLFDKSDAYAQIDRISSTSPTMRGVEFKTNTTNRAIEAYSSSNQTRLDEKIDAIEDFVGMIGYGILQLALQYMEPADIQPILGDRHTNEWQQVLPEELRSRIMLHVVGGSSEKPTSRAKKEQALEMAQALGQFAGNAPGVVMLMLKSFRSAFENDFTVTEEDWDMVMQSIVAEQQTAGGGPGSNAGGGDPAMQQQLPPSQGMPSGGGDPTQQMLDELGV